jgi:hypothetical protein
MQSFRIDAHVALRSFLLLFAQPIFNVIALLALAGIRRDDGELARARVDDNLATDVFGDARCAKKLALAEANRGTRGFWHEAHH